MPKLNEVFKITEAHSERNFSFDIDWEELGTFVQGVINKNFLRSEIRIDPAGPAGGNPRVEIDCKTDAEAAKLREFLTNNSDTFGAAQFSDDDDDNETWPKNKDKRDPDVSKVRVPGSTSSKGQN